MRGWRTYACEDCGEVVTRRRQAGQPRTCERHSVERAEAQVRALVEEARRRPPISGEYCSTSEIGRLLGVSRTRAYQLSCEKDFPEPCQVWGRYRIWLLVDVLRWAALRGRPIPDLGSLPAREPGV